MPESLTAQIHRQTMSRSGQIALSVPGSTDPTQSEEITYAEFGSLTARYIAGFKAAGIKRGDRIILLFPMSISMVAMITALLAMGAVPTFVDPGMGLRRTLQALKVACAKAVVSTDRLLRFRFLIPGLHGRLCYSTDGVRGIPAGVLCHPEAAVWPQPSEEDEDGEGIITFTSGTGSMPKAANRTRSILTHQVHALRSLWQPAPGEVSMSCFPISTLFYLSQGVTCILPAVDLARPGTVRPELIIDQMKKHKVTSLFAAPAFLEGVMDELARQPALPGLQTIVTGGAPVPFRLCEKVCRLFPDSENVILYGSTEAEPVSKISMHEVLPEKTDRGYPVGLPVSAARVQIIRADDRAIQGISEATLQSMATAPLEVGELIVSGSHVVEEYLNHPEANRRTKIRTLEGRLWHRTGDLACFDYAGRIRLTGRRGDVIQEAGRNWQPFLMEAVLDGLPGVQRSALIACKGRPLVCIETVPGWQGPSVTTDVRQVLQDYGLGAEVLLHPIPVDNRHNSKIDRAALRTGLGKAGIGVLETKSAI